MRNAEEQRIALDCLAHARDLGGNDDEVIARAERYLAFVTGKAELQASDRLDLIRNIVASS